MCSIAMLYYAGKHAVTGHYHMTLEYGSIPVGTLIIRCLHLWVSVLGCDV